MDIIFLLLYILLAVLFFINNIMENEDGQLHLKRILKYVVTAVLWPVFLLLVLAHVYVYEPYFRKSNS